MKSTFSGQKRCHSEIMFLLRKVHIYHVKGLEIRNYVMIGPNVTIIEGDHKFDDTSIEMWHHSEGEDNKIIIEDDVWIGANVTLLKKCTHFTRISIGALQRSDETEPYGVYVGNPAKLIRFRKKVILNDE